MAHSQFAAGRRVIHTAGVIQSVIVLLFEPWPGCNTPIPTWPLMIPYLKTLFRYDDWANRESLASLQRVDAPPPRALEVMAHVVGCQWLWIGRLEGVKEPAVVWPELTLNQCADQLGELATVWKDYLGSLTPARLTDRVAYTNSKGEDWESNVRDMLFHVVMHSSYHRGQIATLLGRAGHEPAYTDLIHCIRQQMIDTDSAT